MIRRWNLPTAALLTVPALAASLCAQQPLDSATRDTGQQSRSRIAGIVLQPTPVFDSVESRRFWGYRVLNALHVVTRPWVIREELLFHDGEAYDSARVNETARNLRALGVFRTVRIDTVVTDSGTIVRVTTQDGWTTSLALDLRSSGSQLLLTAGALERNLAGTNTRAQVLYQQNPDRSLVFLSLQRPRLIARTIGMGGTYERRSDGQAATGLVDYPFFSLTSSYGGSLAGEYLNGRVLRFVAGNTTAADSVRRNYEIARASLGLALRSSHSGYVRAGLYAQLRREDYLPGSVAGPFTRTISAAVGPWIEARHADFLTLRGFQTVGRDEDIDLGLDARAQLLVAPHDWGYDRSGAGTAFSFSLGHRVSNGFVLLNGQADGLLNGAGLDSGSVTGSGTMALFGGEHLLGVINVSGGAQRNGYPGEEFDFGLGYGPRAFPAHSFTGNRYFLMSAEGRWMPFPSVLNLVAVGGALFADHAGAWYAGSPRRTGTDAGFGLRLAPLRTGSLIMARLDLAYRFRNDVQRSGFVFVVGEGFAFQRF
ncbi:MAG TPA: hypothetical protein VF722_17255 [Gemmatimonadaceae bacterium]